MNHLRSTYWVLPPVVADFLALILRMVCVLFSSWTRLTLFLESLGGSLASTIMPTPPKAQTNAPMNALDLFRRLPAQEVGAIHTVSPGSYNL